jgi:hypothetical protein
MVKKRTKMFSTIVAALTVTFLFSMSMSVVRATKPIPVEGQIILKGYNSVATDPAGESDNNIITLSLYGMFVGDIAGSYTSESRWVRHNVGAPDVWTNVHAVDTISPATVMDKTGTLTFMLNGKAGEGGNWVVIGGTGELANLHGQGTFAPGANAAVVNYEGQLQFDP